MDNNLSVRRSELIRRLMIPIPKAERYASLVEDEVVRLVMEKSNYDNIPMIDDESSLVIGCWRRRNGSAIRTDIDFSESIDINAGLGELLSKMENRDILFATEESRIVGILTFADLNTREVLITIYELLYELNKSLTDLLSSKMSQDYLLSHKRFKTKARKYYEKDLADGIDRPPIQYLDLSDIIGILSEIGVLPAFGIDQRELNEGLDKIVDVRNLTMHPNKPLFHQKSDVSKTLKSVKLVEQTLFLLRNGPRARQ